MSKTELSLLKIPFAHSSSEETMILWDKKYSKYIEKRRMRKKVRTAMGPEAPTARLGTFKQALPCPCSS